MNSDDDKLSKAPNKAYTNDKPLNDKEKQSNKGDDVGNQSNSNNAKVHKDMTPITTLTNYVDDKEKQLTVLFEDYKDVGVFGCFLDSKVPDERKVFYHPFSLGISDPTAISEAIQKYKNFYESIQSAFTKETNKKKDENGPNSSEASNGKKQNDANQNEISNGKVENDANQSTANNETNGKNGNDASKTNNKKELHEVLSEIKTKLAETYDTAKQEVRKVSSSAIYRLHKSFINDYEKLSNIIKDIQVVNYDALLEKYTDMEKSWKIALKLIEEYKKSIADLNKQCENICNKLATLETENKKMSDGHQTLINENRELKEQVKELLDFLRKK